MGRERGDPLKLGSYGFLDLENRCPPPPYVVVLFSTVSLGKLHKTYTVQYSLLALCIVECGAVLGMRQPLSALATATMQQILLPEIGDIKNIKYKA